MIRRIVAQVPGIALTLWCAEDLPLLWPEVIRAIAGVGAEEVLEGDYDLVATLMKDEGLAALKAFFEAHAPRRAAQRRRATATFLEKYARPEELEVEISLRGWTEALVAAYISSTASSSARSSLSRFLIAMTLRSTLVS